MNKRPVVVKAKPQDLASEVRKWLQPHGRRFGHLTARASHSGSLVLEALLLDTGDGSCTIFAAELESGREEYPSITQLIPAAHRAERAIGDMFGIRAIGHPRPKSLILHDGAWPSDFAPLANHAVAPKAPYEFLQVSGEGIHEIPVGPIHAGIIEPGHFRFSCAGEIIAYLEIRLGYLHRGVEKGLTEGPWQNCRFLAESTSSDTAVGNALAHAIAIEQLLNVELPTRAQHLRTLALELERAACHMADLSGLCSDVGYSPGTSLFAQLRGTILGFAEALTGSRLQRYYVRPGGVSRDLDDDRRSRLLADVGQARRLFKQARSLILENTAFGERARGTGFLSPAHCADFGLVGPASRASGSTYDARQAYSHGLYPAYCPAVASRREGDVLARAQVRTDEVLESLDLCETVLQGLPGGSILKIPEAAALPRNAVGIGIVEAWRGELIHWITTGADGRIERYAIKDPSFNNWTGLSNAIRGNLVADFPLCNKSFSLSYSGHDL